LVRERGVAIVQAARDLDLNHNMLRRWLKEHDGDPKHAFPGLGQLKPEQLEIDRLRKEVRAGPIRLNRFPGYISEASALG
jgi:transposase